MEPDKTPGDTLHEQVVTMQVARPYHRLLAGDIPELDPASDDHDMEMKREAEQKKLHQMAKVHDVLEICQGCQNQRATQKESRAEHKPNPAVGYLSDSEDIVESSWSLFQHDGAAAFKLSEKSPVPPALSAMDLSGGRTEMLNVR